MTTREGLTARRGLLAFPAGFRRDRSKQRGRQGRHGSLDAIREFTSRGRQAMRLASAPYVRSTLVVLERGGDRAPCGQRESTLMFSRPS
jgi:hypothetical protein